VNESQLNRDAYMRGMNSRFVLVGICAWISVCLLIAGWLPDMAGNLNSLWLISGLMGLVSAVGLAEAIKSDIRTQQVLLDEYMHAAMTDGLTGLSNRISLDRMLTSFLKETASRRSALSLVMIDIDHFKAFNDEWGHQAGDAVLRCVSKKMKDFFGGKACVARYGGEEFAVVLPMCHMADASRLADQCRQLIRESDCTFREQSFRVTISGGVTEAHAQDSPDSLTQRADMALYTAKKMGRDMIWEASWHELPGQASSSDAMIAVNEALSKLVPAEESGTVV
jgi:diguanylate cyclase (GGDEF)-like protein